MFWIFILVSLGTDGAFLFVCFEYILFIGFGADKEDVLLDVCEPSEIAPHSPHVHC